MKRLIKWALLVAVVASAWLWVDAYRYHHYETICRSHWDSRHIPSLGIDTSRGEDGYMDACVKRSMNAPESEGSENRYPTMEESVATARGLLLLVGGAVAFYFVIRDVGPARRGDMEWEPLPREWQRR